MKRHRITKSQVVMKVEEMEREKCLSWESKKKKKRESFYVRMVSEHNQCNVCVSVRNKDGSAGHFFIAHNPVGVEGSGGMV